MSASIPSAPKPSRILLVEDDAPIAAEIVAELTARGYDVTHAETGPAGLDLAMGGAFDVLVLDRLLPELDGLAVLARLRAEAVRTPVLVLSALSAVDDRVTGLKAGGDDYLAKPFAMEELCARIEALLRRPSDTRETELVVGPIELDLIGRVARRTGRSLELLPREFRLLEYMARRPNQVLTRDMLLEDVWHYRFIPQTNLVDVHIGKLRRKLDTPDEVPLIQSIRGAGFMLRIPE
ncbi:response regulator transcription factor [Acetobacteraceae bacterium KSS8]|uniref:Response regulator transcription factor n=1 Tax=Endosaccharibacter trunci TaxID=2812733 RepID=A0ABT1W3C9_9PROT|nr:response regulator transcription factor [Acetobacteraceae bacterium KSS8]